MCVRVSERVCEREDGIRRGLPGVLNPPSLSLSLLPLTTHLSPCPHFPKAVPSSTRLTHTKNS